MSGALERRVRTVDGVVACTIDAACVVHVLVGFDARPDRVVAAVADVVGPGHEVRVVGAPPQPRPWRAVVGDLVPVFAAVVAATVLAAGGSALLGTVLDAGGTAGGVPVVADRSTVEASEVRTAQPAPARPEALERPAEVLGEVVEAPPPAP